jgi:hypothetical protein
MKKIAILFASLLWAGTMFAVPTMVGAQGSDIFGLSYGEETGLGQQDPRQTAARIIRAGLGLLGIVAIVIVLYGGVLWMTAGGETDKVGKARKVLFSGVIGLIIILSAFAIAQFVLDQLIEATGTQV